MNVTHDECSAAFEDLLNTVGAEIDEEYEAGDYIDLEDVDTLLTTHRDSKQPEEYDAEDDLDLPSFVVQVEQIDTMFTPMKVLGKGASCIVSLAQSVYTHRQHALKDMDQSDPANYYAFLAEITILKRLDHPSIITLASAAVTESAYFISTPYCSGGTLLERIRTLKRLSEHDCAQWVKTILSAVHHMHSQSIVHRDLKFRNIVFSHQSAEFGQLKIIDFGQSEHIVQYDAIDQDITGSLWYMPPEMMRLRRKNELFAADMWAVGVMTFAMIQGRFPFMENSIDSMLTLLNDKKWKLTWQKGITVSDTCRDFIQCLLTRDPGKRMTATQAINHAWIVNQQTNQNLGKKYFDQLRTLDFTSALQSVMVNAAIDNIEHNRMDKETLTTMSLSQAGTRSSRVIQHILSHCQPRSRVSTIYFKDDIHAMQSSWPDAMDIDNMLDDMGAPNVSHPGGASSNISGMLLKEFTPKRFQSILISSPVPFDVDTIMAKLTDNFSEPITYEKISMYSGSLPILE